jgi:hypothetical protein
MIPSLFLSFPFFELIELSLGCSCPDCRVVFTSDETIVFGQEMAMCSSSDQFYNFGKMKAANRFLLMDLLVCIISLCPNLELKLLSRHHLR